MPIFVGSIILKTDKEILCEKDISLKYQFKVFCN